ncbi:MAG: response regulator transcription factor [Oscillospiraceae bacterium]|nr:response regulator transcription factor [Oscillospiraceae bacterium]
MEKNILVVEDEDVIREFIVINLKRAGYTVTDVSSGEKALEIFSQDKNKFLIAVLDIMMPGIDGFEVCKTIRKQNDKMGIIMLSARSQEIDKVSGLMMGADDYMTKPFSPSELVARVDAVTRRVSMVVEKENKDKLISGPFVLDFLSKTLYKLDEEIDLTQIEFQLMKFFMSNPDIAKSRQDILESIWGDSEGDIKVVDVNIRRLRVKIEDDPSDPKYILTVWGYGYRWGVKN